jgi:hypothetical protein
VGLEAVISTGDVGILMDAAGGIKTLQMTQQQADLEIKLIQVVTILGAEFIALCLGLNQMGALF